MWISRRRYNILLRQLKNAVDFSTYKRDTFKKGAMDALKNDDYESYIRLKDRENNVIYEISMLKDIYKEITKL
jgi:hypothetical protein